MSVEVVVQWEPAVCRTMLRRQGRRVFADNFLCEGVVDSLLERGGLFDKAGGDQPGSEAFIAGARQDRVAAPDAERVIAGGYGAQQRGWNRREEGLHHLGDRLGRTGVEPFLCPVEASHHLL